MVKLSMNEYGIVRSYAIGKGVELMHIKRAREIRRAFVLHEKQVYT